jgi:hypothetical protein
MTMFTDRENDGWIALASAIVEGAIKEYIAARRALLRNPGDGYATDKLVEQRQFFLSGYFETLSLGMDGEWLMRRLDKLIDEKAALNAKKRRRRRA